MLMSDLTKRQRYTELVEFTWLPPLRQITRIISTESHLNEATSMPEFLAANPGDVTLTKEYETSGMTPSLILFWTQVYTGQLESLLGRWVSGDYEILQVGCIPPPHAPTHGVRHAPISRASRLPMHMTNNVQ